jgi:alkaline phosphatase
MPKFKASFLAALLILGLSSCPGAPRQDAWPVGVILFIGDGMGPDHVRAGSYFLGWPLSFQDFPVRATLTTFSADNSITDSAAAATAMATGRKVGNGVLSMAIPGTGDALETILEKAAKAGWRTGLVTTTYLTHATPAAFASHQTSRALYSAIARDYLSLTRPDLLLGGGGNGLYVDDAVAAGYTVAATLKQLRSIPTDPSVRVAGLFGSSFLSYESDGGPHAQSHPDLADMTEQALRLLEDSSEGFFLMIESGLIDQAAHANDAARMVGEVSALDRAVSVARTWAEGRDDVIIVVTADHETGGISSVSDRGLGQVPAITWTTTGHTARPVDLYASGLGAWRFVQICDNTQVYAGLLE